MLKTTDQGKGLNEQDAEVEYEIGGSSVGGVLTIQNTQIEKKAVRFAGVVVLLILTLASLPPTGAARAQTSEGKIEGGVFTVAPNGERYFIPGAQVLLTPAPESNPLGQASPQPMKSATDASGHFAFEGVPDGCYRATGTSAGLSGESQEICLPGSAAVIKLDIEMKLAVVKQSVEVTANADGIETIESSVTEAIQPSILSHPPTANERVDSLLPLIPGVVRGPDGRINMKGARDMQSGSLVNSTNVTDPFTGASAINLPIDVVSSVEVLSNPYDSVYGKFAGAVSAVETKTSSFEKFHFTAQNFVPRTKWRDGSFLGIGKFTPRLTVTGPLWRGRIAGTQSIEYKYVLASIDNAGLPALHKDTGLESFDSFTQFDFKISDRHMAALHLSFYPQKLNYVGLNTFTPQPATPNFRQRGYQVSWEDLYAFNSGALLESRLSFRTFDGDIKANSFGLYRRGIETTEGGFFNLQHRDTSRLEAAEIYHFAPITARGQHLIKVGYDLVRNTYDGRQIFNPVEILGVSDRLVARIDFTAPTRLNVNQNEYTFFAQDKWTVLPRLTLDLGLRFDRDSTTHENHLAPRLGFAYQLTNDSKTVLRGGFGLYYDRINLNVPTFLNLPARTETRFSPAGAVLETLAYRHRLAGDIRNPRSTAWSLQLEREVVQKLVLRIGYQQRNTTRNFLLNPNSTAAGDFLTLSNSGRDRYREFEITARYRLRNSSQMTASYVRSSAIGNLNDFNTFFGNVAQAVIRPDERSRLPFDAPNRFLFWADLEAPFKLTVSPVLDVHSGFPYSVVNEQLHFVGTRNRAGRFPTFASFDVQVLRLIRLPLVTHKARVGVKFFNLFSHFNPIDIQNNLASPRFGAFSNHRRIGMGGKFVVDF